MPEPVTLIIVGAAVLAVGEDGARAGGTPPRGPFGSQWIWPLPTWRGYVPRVSDFFQAQANKEHRQHLGVDIMYRRMKGGVVTSPEEPIDNVNGSSGYFVPQGMVAVACHDGEIWSTGESDLGFNVVLDLGKPYAAFYQHLSTLLVPVGIKGGKHNGSPWPIRAGDPLGVVGGARTGYGLRHLHFEIWHNGAREAAIDPNDTNKAPAKGLNKWKTWG